MAVTIITIDGAQEPGVSSASHRHGGGRCPVFRGDQEAQEADTSCLIKDRAAHLTQAIWLQTLFLRVWGHRVVTLGHWKELSLNWLKESSFRHFPAL